MNDNGNMPKRVGRPPGIPQPPGTGRPKGIHTPHRKPWQRFLDNVEAAANRVYTRKKLVEMAQTDPFRFAERLVIPLARPNIELLAGDGHIEQLPLVFYDDPRAEIGELIEGELAARGIDLAEAVRDK